MKKSAKKTSVKKVAKKTAARTWALKPSEPLMSVIVKEMISQILIHGDDAPNPVKGLAILLANIAWNRAIGFPDKHDRCLKQEIAETKRAMPNLWDEFVDADHNVLIGKLIQYKLKKYPDDERLIVGAQIAPDARYEEGGRIRIAYVPKAMQNEFRKIPQKEQFAMLFGMLDEKGNSKKNGLF
jgi:hypothetical protein